MSEILVNKLTGTSTAGSIVVTGEGNSTTTNLAAGVGEGVGGIMAQHNRDSFTYSLNRWSGVDTSSGCF